MRRSHLGTHVVVIFVATLLALSLSIAAADQDCACDADGDGRVAVAELVQAVRNALGGCPPAATPCNGDADCDGAVAISELIAGVNNALNGCGVVSATVVDVGWLRARLERPNIQVLDARVSGFDGGHIPGALPLSPYTLARTVDGVPTQIVTVEEGAAVLDGIGLRPDSIAVVYGVAPEFDPARVTWALRYLGHPNVRYLDGGFAAWVDAGAPVDPGDPLVGPASGYSAQAAREELRVDGAWVLQQLGDPPYDSAGIQIVDARSPAEYQSGRIPTAVHVRWTRNLDESGQLLSRQTLEDLYAGEGLDPSRTTVVYCLAGWRASVAWLVLEWLGFEDVRVYDGSWFEWGEAENGFPIETDS